MNTDSNINQATVNHGYKEAFFIVPTHIDEMEGMTLGFLRVFKTIFEFLNKGKPCFLSNKKIAERARLNVRQVHYALKFFYKHNKLKRVRKGNKYYLIEPEKSIEIDKPSPEPKLDDRDKKPGDDKCNQMHAGGAVECTQGVQWSAPINKEDNINKTNNRVSLKNPDKKKVDKPNVVVATEQKNDQGGSGWEGLSDDEKQSIERLALSAKVSRDVVIEQISKNRAENVVATLNHMLLPQHRGKIENPPGWLVASLKSNYNLDRGEKINREIKMSGPHPSFDIYDEDVQHQKNRELEALAASRLANYQEPEGIKSRMTEFEIKETRYRIADLKKLLRSGSPK